jgi:glutathione-specific gamma-glutamylcyclotransferase
MTASAEGVFHPLRPQRLTEHELAASLEATLAIWDRRSPVWLFAYGSLIWKPEVEHVEERIGTARGWHRSFCLGIVRWRGTADEPGLMMALDRGGQCKGVLYRLPGETLEAQLGKLFRREMSVKPPNNMPRWIAVDTPVKPGEDQERVRALAFVMNRNSRFYAGRLPFEEVADRLARACGHWGSCAEYLHNTVSHLEERGIHDRNLWRLQALVAERIAASAASPEATGPLADRPGG